MDLNVLLTAVVGLHASIDRLRADLERAGVVPPRVAPSAHKGKRRGRVEVHVIETLERFAGQHVVPAQTLMETAIALLPVPNNGKRDTRKQTVLRAMKTLSAEKDGPISWRGEIITINGSQASDLI